MHTNKIYVSMRKQITMGDMQFNGTPEEWDALVKKNREITIAQTAMQKLWEWIDANCHEDNFNINNARDISLKMEKEQIVKAYDNVLIDGIGDFANGEEYYNETYNK